VQRVLKRYGVYAVKTKFGERVIDMKNNRATVEFRTLPLSKAHRIPPIRWLVTLEYANKEWTITRAKSLGIIMPGEGD